MVHWLVLEMLANKPKLYQNFDRSRQFRELFLTLRAVPPTSADARHSPFSTKWLPHPLYRIFLVITLACTWPGVSWPQLNFWFAVHSLTANPGWVSWLRFLSKRVWLAHVAKHYWLPIPQSSLPISFVQVNNPRWWTRIGLLRAMRRKRNLLGRLMERILSLIQEGKAQGGASPSPSCLLWICHVRTWYMKPWQPFCNHEVKPRDLERNWQNRATKPWADKLTNPRAMYL